MSKSAGPNSALDAQALANFQEYLRIPSVHPNINYDDCVKFLQKQAKELGLPVQIHHPTTGKPVVILSWIGSQPNLPTVLLNSHMDVVPVYEEKWTYKPFSAHIDEKNNIYARGTQDMKSVGIQYLEAIRRMKQKGVVLKRTLHVSFVPEEEVGGHEGMAIFVKSKAFKDLNVGVALDEGMASPDENFILFYGERCIWHMHIHCPGQPGHGSLLHENTAGEKVRHLLDRFFTFREQEKLKLKNNPQLTIGDVTTVNLTQLQGGVQSNVVPPEFVIVIDCRIPVTVDIKEWEETVNRWCKEAGNGVWIEFEQKEPQIPVTTLDYSNPYWIAFRDASKELGLPLKHQIFPGGTDSRYVRELGLPALGFSPINNTPVLLHDHNEFLGVDTFLKGIEIYSKLLTAVANVEETTG